MKFIPHVGLAVCCVLLTVPAMAQLDSSALRAKYGPPLNRETYRMPAGFDVIVDYGAGNQVCKIQVPALMPTQEKIARAAEMKQRMYDFLVVELSPKLRQPVKTHFSLNGELSYGNVSTEVHEGV